MKQLFDLAMFDYTDDEIMYRLDNDETILITANIIVNKFKQLNKKIETLSPQMQETLTKWTLLKEATASNDIESIIGNSNKIYQAFDEKIDLTGGNEFIWNVVSDLKDIHNNEIHLTLFDLLHLHDKFEIEKGFKKQDNVIAKSNGEIVFAPPSHLVAEQYTRTLIDNYHNRCDNQLTAMNLIRALAFSYDLVCIHPFIDGNGRTSRLIIQLVLHKLGIKAIWFDSLSDKIHKYIWQYYQNLKIDSDNWYTTNPTFNHIVKYLLDRCDDLINNLNSIVESEIWKNPWTYEFLSKQYLLQQWFQLDDIKKIQSNNEVDEKVIAELVKYRFIGMHKIDSITDYSNYSKMLDNDWNKQ